MKRKLLTLSVASVISAGTLIAPLSSNFAFAQSIKEKQKNVQSNIQKKMSEISNLSAQAKEMESEMNEITAKVNATNAKIKDTTQKVNDTKQEINALQVKIKETKQRIAERNKVLQDRARSIQQSDGSDSYLDVLLSSQSFGDFIDRAVALTTFVNADHKILQEQEADKKVLEQSEADLNNKLQQVQQDLASLEDLKAQLKYQIDDKNSILAKIKEEQKAAKGELGNLQDQAASLAEQEKAAEAEQEKERLAYQRKTSSSSSHSSGIHQSSANSQPSSSGSSAPSDGPVYHGSAAIEAAISAGSSIVGRSPYNWGGGRSSSDIENRSFDCSSFVRWAYAMAGVNLGSITGTSTNTLVYQGRAVSASEMKRGDLLFFDTYKTNGHVGIYLGNGQFLDDNSSNGVSIDSLSNPYWKKTFNGVVRRVVE
ncbi:C40 family peptidase [Bacillus sp. APMAM]|uniref:C40 family peptidase n=1 Tax=Margalitia sp. FSL K6-0131 TaxID=2954604 RepID=UPI000F89B374|nr:C40 family peptidase [Bacillus sp. APMAM]RTZ57138.1 peptidase C40 [Bacillus sp. SAJ1]